MTECQVRVGYACINLSLNRKFRTFRWRTLETKDSEKIRQVIQSNMILLRDILEDNIKKNIFVYRITADLIPFIETEEMKSYIKTCHLLEEDDMQKIFDQIKQWQKEYDLRISLHASHFTMLASPREEVVERSIEVLREQSKLLKRIGGRNVVMHIGGAYGNKEVTLERFKANIKRYEKYIDLEYLTIENDDKLYTSEDIVKVCKALGLKWVYDYHHERCNPSTQSDIVDLLKKYPPDKYHLSSGINGVIKPPHADYILKEDVEGLLHQLNQVGIKEADIIFEAKKKDLAIFKVMEPMENGYWKIKTTKF